jgi:glucose 1-dehydrogenase
MTPGRASTFARLLSEVPLGRVGQPSEVAGLAASPAADAAASITGSTSFVDGGMLRQSGSLLGRR